MAQVFTRTVCDTLHGVGKLGLGRLFNGRWSAVHRCIFAAWPPWGALQKFRRRQDGALLEMTPATAEAFAKLVRRIYPDRPRILAGVSMDFSGGSGEAPYSAVQHLANGIYTNRVIGQRRLRLCGV